MCAPVTYQSPCWVPDRKSLRSGRCLSHQDRSSEGRACFRLAVQLALVLQDLHQRRVFGSTMLRHHGASKARQPETHFVGSLGPCVHCTLCCYVPMSCHVEARPVLCTRAPTGFLQKNLARFQGRLSNAGLARLALCQLCC